MKRVLIIYPHFPPSNLVGVHRVRLFAQHLPSFGWEPIILTVHENFYEEKHDFNLVKLLPQQLRIEKVNALKVSKSRLIGDIGLRGFFQLYKKAKSIIKTEKIDFLLISIPSFYCALLGRLLHNTTGVKYGIDYQDPWVHYFPGSEKLFSRHWISTKIAKFLEPIAIKNASLICGISDNYFFPVLARNKKLSNVQIGSMPMGGEINDYKLINDLDIAPYLFKKKDGKIQFVYAGAFLPKAIIPLHKVFAAIEKNKERFLDIEFHFIGTGKVADKFAIKHIAEAYNLWNSIVFEYPNRIPYLDVLIHLNIASAVFILGSTEAHYTPSKVYQAVLSKKPILAVLHQQSSAVSVIKQSNTGVVLSFNGVDEVNKIETVFAETMNFFRSFHKTYSEDKIDLSIFKDFSAKEVTNKLANLLDATINNL